MTFWNSIRGLSGLILIALLVCLPVAGVWAEEPVTFGFAPEATDLMLTFEQAESLGSYLATRLDATVQVRSFASEDQLYDWLGRYRQVDIALFSDGYLKTLPAGAILPLTGGQSVSGEVMEWQVVARQGLNVELLQQLRNTLADMNERAEGQRLLGELGIGRLLPPLSVGRTQVALEKPAQEQRLPVADSLSRLPTVVSPGQGGEVRSPEKSPPTRTAEGIEMAETPETSIEVSAPVESVATSPGAATEPIATEAPEAPEPVAPGEITLEADSLSYNQDNDIYEGTGSVLIRRDGESLRADQVVWQGATQDVAAQGNVSLSDGQGEISAGSMQYNLSTGHGQLRDGRILIRDRNFHLAGDEIEKVGDASYRVAHGSFTTCDGEVPDWKFTGEDLDVTLGRYLTAKNVLFHVNDVPLLYLPYLVYPVKSERESGLLMPRLGYSSSKGVKASMAWYQVIDRNMDATLYLDYLSEVGAGKGLEYRYYAGQQNTGRSLYYHVSGISKKPDMYYLEWDHEGLLPGDIWLHADVNYTQDRTFFEEFGESAEDYNRDEVISSVWAKRDWDPVNVILYGRYIKNLEIDQEQTLARRQIFDLLGRDDDDYGVIQEDNDGTLQRLPELGVTLPLYRLGSSPVYAGVESYATNFWREEGEKGQRLYLGPRLNLAGRPGSWLEIRPEVKVHERLYYIRTTDRDAAPRERYYYEDSNFKEVAVPEFATTLSTRLNRVFDVETPWTQKVKHSIEPQVTYRYIPETDQDDLPLFDVRDRILETNRIEYALINRLTARLEDATGPVYHEFANLRLSQSYDVGEARDDHPDGPRRPFSDLRVELDLRPTRLSYFVADSEIAVYGDSGFNKVELSTGYRDTRGNNIGLGYNYRKADEVAEKNEYLSLNLSTSLLKPVYLHYEKRYDFDEHNDLENLVGIEYRSQCWSVILTYRDRYREGLDDEQEVMVNFVLAGLTPSGGIFGAGGFAGN